MPAAMNILDADIRNAESIHTVDPHDPNAAGHQLWGERSSNSVAATPDDPKIIAVELPSDDHVALLDLIDRIERVKGRLPPDVQVLRRNLAS